MISLLKKTVSYILSVIRDEPKNEPTFDIDSVIATIEFDERIYSTQSEVTELCKTNVADTMCQHRVGTVTSLHANYGIIDGTFYFDLRDGPAEKLCEGHRVAYLAFRRQENEEWRVRKIYCVQDENWDEHYIEEAEVDNVEQIQEVSELKNKDVMKRNIIGQVIKREEREVMVMPENIRFSLNEVSTEFTPVEGDWVVLEASVEVNEAVCDLGGEVLDVVKVSPLRSRIVTGCISFWNKNNEGTVDKDVYFTRDSCEPGYMPCQGDRVVVEAIESEQGNCTWRALTLVPLLLHHTEKKALSHTAQEINNPAKFSEELKTLLENKGGIDITECMDFGVVKLGEKRELIAKVTNVGSHNQCFIRGKFHSRRSESQFILHRPRDGELHVINPGQSVEFYFSCKGKFIGSTSELFVFSFKGFKIGRHLLMEVYDPSQNSLISSINQKDNVYNYQQNSHQTKRNGIVVPGIRPIKPPPFVAVRLGMFPVPDRLWNAVVGINGEKRSFDNIEIAVENVAPCLASDLKISNYSDRFHALLHLEEIHAKLSAQKFDLERVCFRPAGPGGIYLALEVPGLSEKRPSVLLGDRIIASNPMIEDDGDANIQFEGYIHKVFSSEVWIKFNSNFHSSYNGNEYNISFHLGRMPLRRCHAAVNMVLTHLGPQMLFPTMIKLQPAQLHLEEVPSDILLPALENINQSNIPEAQCLLDMQNSNYEPGVKLGSQVIKDLISDENSSRDFNTNHCFSVPASSNLVSSDKYVEPRQAHLSQNGFVNEIKIPDFQKRKLKWFNNRLNFQQKEAILNILKGKARPLPYVIFGPPGTGKTVTLVEAILQILTLLPDSRLLVATPSNSSADLIAERLLDSGQLIPGDMVRFVGYHYIEEGKIPERLVPFCTTGDIRCTREDTNKPPPIGEPLQISSSARTLGRHRITVGTCISIGQLHTMGFSRGHFTHIFVDEAGQATEPEIMVPLGFIHTGSGQIILAGDPLQLGPVVMSPLASRMGLIESYLSRLLHRFPYQRDRCGFPLTAGYNPHLVTKLTSNYRSVPELLSLPSSLFYDSSLESQVSQTTGPEADLLASLASELPQRSSNDGGPPALVFHGVRGENFQEEESPSWFNPQEIVQALYYINLLYHVGLTPDDIGVITPYQKQVKKIRILLEELEVPIPKVGSVEEFQGQERKVIIMSAVRSTPSLLKTDIRHTLGFVASPKRLNVALTRARALLIILGNPHLLARDPYWKSVLNYCVERRSYTGCALPLDCESLTLDDDDDDI